MTHLASVLAASGMAPPDAIGHRIVHGGPARRQHCEDSTVPRLLKAAAAFAPLHTPAALAPIRLAHAHCPDVPQVACFDTRLHVGLPDVVVVLPTARDLRSESIQRFRFHGLWLESIVRQLGDALPQRLLVAHLGNGASITAVKAGLSIDSGMAMMPSSGVIMVTRSGNLDPGVLVHLLREKKFDAAMLEGLVDQLSGLLGISGLSGDMRVCRKRLHRTAMHAWPSRCSVIRYANRWPR